MKLHLHLLGVLLTLVVSSSTHLAAQSPAGPNQPLSRVEVRVETIANREDGPGEPCEAAQTVLGAPLAFWSTLGEAGPSEKAGAFELRSAAGRCGSGQFPLPSGRPQAADGGSIPFLILEISATPGWDPGPMDPGPVPVVQVTLALTSRRLTGFSEDGKPVYSGPVADHRSARLGEGEEFLLPVLPTGGPQERAGIPEGLVRIRAGWAGRPGATAYGALSVVSAAPGSDILLDEGNAGKAGSDGTLLLSTVPVGQRAVSLRGASGPPVTRRVSIVKGRTVVVSPEAGDAGGLGQPAFTAADKNSQGFPEFRRMRDGAVMVLIPGGEFLMGNLDTEGAPLPHTVNLSSAFLMDKLPVTVARFRRFAAATGRPLPPDPYWGVHDDSPVAFVRWDEARAYCEWAGGRLPTEAEREKAARGTDNRLFPWGSEPPSPERAVFRRNWGNEGNSPVGMRPAGASPYGLLDMGGNMWESCEDWYDPDYYKSSPQTDPMGPKTGRAHVVRGGSWDSRPTVLSASSRSFSYVGYREGDFGFRCAAEPPR